MHRKNNVSRFAKTTYNLERSTLFDYHYYIIIDNESPGRAVQINDARKHAYRMNASRIPIE